MANYKIPKEINSELKLAKIFIYLTSYFYWTCNSCNAFSGVYSPFVDYSILYLLCGNWCYINCKTIL